MLLATATPVATNRLLARLSQSELRALGPTLEHVRLPLNRILYEAGEPLKELFFPTSGIVSLLYVNDAAASCELTIVGREGLVGLSLLLGGERATSRAVVQSAGGAYRLSAAAAKAAFAKGGHFQALALKYTHSRLLELAQTAFCNLHHRLEQQLSRWLLLCLDRLQSDEIQMTHEMIASMLGVRRQGVTEAARKLQERRIIVYSRGRITVLDRLALEGTACECYGSMKRQIAALFGERSA
jgi:CRP-like cAMP-binding protein